VGVVVTVTVGGSTDAVADAVLVSVGGASVAVGVALGWAVAVIEAVTVIVGVGGGLRRRKAMMICASTVPRAVVVACTPT
jgi:phosphoribosylformimino-5-aminoimidazole carboxamide ribonucleotide (ProFAR) isomerase